VSQQMGGQGEGWRAKTRDAERGAVGATVGAEGGSACLLVTRRGESGQIALRGGAHTCKCLLRTEGAAEAVSRARCRGSGDGVRLRPG
jgi:hypothetical protein